MRRSVSWSSGRGRSIRSPFDLATRAASARRGLMDLAMSSAVVPFGTSLVLPSGSLTWMLSDIDKALYSAESLEFKGGNGEGQTDLRPPTGSGGERECPQWSLVVPTWFLARSGELLLQTSLWPTPRPYRARSTRWWRSVHQLASPEAGICCGRWSSPGGPTCLRWPS